MRISITNFRNLVSDILLENLGQHRCLDGSIVPEESEACLTDVEDRIDDAVYHRDICSMGSDQRQNLNGVLKGLRKKRRRLTKNFMPAVNLVVDA